MSRTTFAWVCWAMSLLIGHGCARPIGTYIEGESPDPVCGNGVVETGEACDGLGLGGATCWDLGFDDGSLQCASTCTLDTSGCFNDGFCGDGALDFGEQCDLADFGGETCESLGYTGGTLACTQFCSFEREGCGPPGFCGNGVIEGDEQCDDGNLDPCDGCDESCSQEVCGNDRIDCGEECDGSDLGGLSCMSFGFPRGSVTCASDCQPDSSACNTGMLPELYEDWEDLALAQSRWTLSGDWEIGSPYSSAEPSAFEGSSCLATRIGSSYSDDRDYLSNMAISSTVDLSLSAHPILRFKRWISIETCCDAMNVWIRPTLVGTWLLLDSNPTSYTATVNGQLGWSGSGPTLADWTTITFELSGYGNQGAQIAFSMATDPNVALAGAYIDNVFIGDLANAPYGP